MIGSSDAGNVTANPNRLLHREAMALRPDHPPGSASRQTCRDVIARLMARGAQGIVLAAPKSLAPGEDSVVPLFDTTSLQVEAAVERTLSAQSSPELCWLMVAAAAARRFAKLK
jgi:hypothetical protein